LFFSLSVCPQCDELRAQLADLGVPVDKVFVKWDKATPQYQSLKSQLIKLTGCSQFTFPQTFVRAEYEGHFHDVKNNIAAGKFDVFFSEVFGIAPPVKEAAETASLELGFDDDF